MLSDKGQAHHPLEAIEVIALMVWALPQPDRSSVHEFSVFADKPVALIRESLIDAATSLNNVSALCPQFANELCESFAAIPSLHWHQTDPAPLFLDNQRSSRSGPSFELNP